MISLSGFSLPPHGYPTGTCGVAIDTRHPFRAQVIAIGLVLMMRSPAGDRSAIAIGGHLQRLWRNIFLHCDVVDLASPINKPSLYCELLFQHHAFLIGIARIQNMLLLNREASHIASLQ